MTVKKTVGARIIEGLAEFTDALESGEPLSKRLHGHFLWVEITPSRYRPQDIRATRRLLSASQRLFAAFLGVALGTVRAWEQGRNVPSGSAARLLDEIRLNPEFWKARFTSSLKLRSTQPIHTSKRRLRRTSVRAKS